MARFTDFLGNVLHRVARFARRFDDRRHGFARRRQDPNVQRRLLLLLLLLLLIDSSVDDVDEENCGSVDGDLLEAFAGDAHLTRIDDLTRERTARHVFAVELQLDLVTFGLFRRERDGVRVQSVSLRRCGHLAPVHRHFQIARTRLTRFHFKIQKLILILI